ncbi:MAG TPA: DUF1801 domain-containing protein [Gemmatimonadaceae bacterium]|nr:DUF1801 domain-containing protein [Gemmatimonadaceae bacterium]
MKPATTAPATVDEYIAAFPAGVRRKLTQMRRTIQRAAPGAEESIAYRMPAYKLQGALVYFAAHTAHIGFYPMTDGVKRRYATELADYDTAKGTVRFPLDEPLPTALIEGIVACRMEENAARAAKKRGQAR